MVFVVDDAKVFSGRGRYWSGPEAIWTNPALALAHPSKIKFSQNPPKICQKRLFLKEKEE